MISGFRIGNVEIPTYWVMLIIGATGMLLCTLRRRKLFGLQNWQCWVFVLLLTVVGVTGAMLLYFWESGSIGGVSFYGSVFLIPILMPLIGLMFRMKREKTMDICGPCVAIMIGCMRFSCFLTGCCGGWTVCVGRFCFEWPTQMLDSTGDFVIMTYLLHIEERNPQSGKLYPLFMVAYSGMRFCLEFLRDTAKNCMYLSRGQWYAIIALFLGILWIRWQSRRTNPPKNIM